jgi:hypothetical protein
VSTGELRSNAVSARTPHNSPDVEAALTRLEEIGGFCIDVRQEGHIYGFIRYLKGDPNCASMTIWSNPRDGLVCARKIMSFARPRLHPKAESELTANANRGTPIDQSQRELLNKTTVEASGSDAAEPRAD